MGFVWLTKVTVPLSNIARNNLIFVKTNQNQQAMI
jgi:hypothetical protein